ncbi:MAG: hydrogenase nickel incorporation protein HypB [Armatimonadetes bacterium]|nr:hydrogenase nickel incorporation protein HypB [Armatimonadota bacterium]
MRVDVVHNVLKLNDALAAQIRARLHAAGIFTLNVISAPGSGKTTLLERTLAHFGAEIGQAVIVGDLATSRDAERLAPFARAVQVNTDGGCHLDAAMVANALEALDLTGVELLWVENVGNLVCPVGFDLGHDVKVGLLSVPEGEDKVAKYPRLWREADAVLLNKVDLLPYVSFDRERFYADLRAINETVPVFEVQATTAETLRGWFEWVAAARAG